MIGLHVKNTKNLFH